MVKKKINQKDFLYDIIFLDPPFYSTLLEDTIALIKKNINLKDKTWIYLEKEKTKNNINIPNNWVLHKEKTTGKVNYCIYIYKKDEFLEEI